MVQVPFTTIVAGQLLVCAKSEALAPLIAMLMLLRSRLPDAVRVTFIAVLVVPSGQVPKFREVGDAVPTAVIGT